VDTISIRALADPRLLQHMRRRREVRVDGLGTLDAADDSSRPRDWETRSGSTEMQVGKGRFRVFISSRGGPLTVTIEGSVARMVDGHNLNGLPLDRLLSTVIDLHAHIASELPGCPADLAQWRYARLDLTRDLDDVSDPSEVLRRWASIPPGNRIDQIVYSKGSGRIESVIRGPQDRWRVTCYDKGREVAAHARRTRDPEYKALLRSMGPEVGHRIRVELQLKDDLLRVEPIGITAEETPARLEELMDHYLSRASADRLTARHPRSGDEVVNGIIRTLGRASARSALIAALQALRPAMDQLYSENAAAAGRAVLRGLGLRPEDLID
jgi:hypothetical protein